MIHYRVELKSPEAHLFEVVLKVPEPDPDGQKIFMPAWIPGSYMIRDFARNIVSLSVFEDQRILHVTKLDKQTWQVEPSLKTIHIVYQVYAWDTSVRGAYLDTTRAFITGPSLFVKVIGAEMKPCRVEFIAPTGDRYRNWRLATTLTSEDAKFLEFGIYRAEEYDELIDHPIEIGSFTHTQFLVGAVPHEIVISGHHTADQKRLTDDLKEICEHHIRFFGELPAMERYLFQVNAVGEGYGGLEHRSSTSLICKRSDLPQEYEKDITDGYRKFLGLCSHEYFHLWNIKRIRPEELKRAGLASEVHTRLLWLFEGVTSYYDDLALVRSGRITQESYLELLARQITQLLRTGGRLKQTLAESSFDAWTRFYKQDENSPNTIVSYYNKGALVALCLDLLLRRECNGQVSLDDLMRALWVRYGKTDIGLSEGEFERLAEEISGIDLSEFFISALHRTSELPLPELLATVGIGSQYLPASDKSDLGGIRKDCTAITCDKMALGAQFVGENQNIKLTVVYEGGAAQNAGLSAGDVIVAVDGIRLGVDEFERSILNAAPDKLFRIHAFRRDELMIFDLKAEPAPANTCVLWVEKSAMEQTVDRRNQWLGQHG